MCHSVVQSTITIKSLFNCQFEIIVRLIYIQTLSGTAFLAQSSSDIHTSKLINYLKIGNGIHNYKNCLKNMAKV